MGIPGKSILIGEKADAARGRRGRGVGDEIVGGGGKRGKRSPRDGKCWKTKGEERAMRFRLNDYATLIPLNKLHLDVSAQCVCTQILYIAASSTKIVIFACKYLCKICACPTKFL